MSDLKKNLTLAEVEGLLKTTEHLSSVPVNMDGTGKQTVFSLPSGWNVGLKAKEGLEITDATMGIGDQTWHLSKEAALGIAHGIGLPPAYVMKTPGVLVQSHLNYWAQHSPDLNFKMLVANDNALAITKESIAQFSNTDLLYAVLETCAGLLPSEEDSEDWTEQSLLIDGNSHHDLHGTTLRIAFPQELAVKVQTQRYGGTVEDTWTYGVQLRNSLTGKFPLSVQGFLWSPETEGGIVLIPGAARFNRKTMGQDLFEVLEWVRSATQDVFQHLPHAADTVQTLASESIAKGLSKVLADVFQTYKVPLKGRHLVMDYVSDRQDFTYYGLVTALIKAANNPELPPHHVTTILEICGDLAEQAHDRCTSCQRLAVV